MKIRPICDRIVVERLDEQAPKAGTIVVPDSAKDKSQQAKVIAVGSGRLLENGKRERLEVKVGDKVLVTKYGGTEVELDGHEYLVLKETDILGVMR